MLVLKGDKVKLVKKYYEKALRVSNIKHNIFIVSRINGNMITIISNCGQRFSVLEKNIEIITEKEVKVCMSDSLKSMFRTSKNTKVRELLEELKRCDSRKCEKNYFDIKVDSNKKNVGISFLHISKYRRIENEEFFESKNRDVTKPIKIINEILTSNNKQPINKELELEILNMFSLQDFYDFKIVTGDDITKYYSQEYYVDGGGSLNNSCMRYFKDTSNVFNLYKDNAKMLIMKDKKSDIIYGRALIWTITNKNSGEKIKFMDRIYVQKEIYELLFIEYAKSNGFGYLDKQQRGMSCFVYNNKVIKLVDYHVELSKNISEYSLFPYCDTWYSVPDLFGNILDCGSNSADIELIGTSGNFCLDDDYMVLAADVCRWYSEIISKGMPMHFVRDIDGSYEEEDCSLFIDDIITRLENAFTWLEFEYNKLSKEITCREKTYDEDEDDDDYDYDDESDYDYDDEDDYDYEYDDEDM